MAPDLFIINGHGENSIIPVPLEKSDSESE
jgi:hypothetical protein